MATPNGRNIGPSDRQISRTQHAYWCERTRELEFAFGHEPFTAADALEHGCFSRRQWSPRELDAIELRSNVGCPYDGRILAATRKSGTYRLLSRGSPVWATDTGTGDVASHDQCSQSILSCWSHAPDRKCTCAALPGRDQFSDACRRLNDERARLVGALAERFKLGECITTARAYSRDIQASPLYDDRGTTAFGMALGRTADTNPPTAPNSLFVVRLGKHSRNSQTAAFTLTSWEARTHLA